MCPTAWTGWVDNKSSSHDLPFLFIQPVPSCAALWALILLIDSTILLSECTLHLQKVSDPYGLTTNWGAQCMWTPLLLVLSHPWNCVYLMLLLLCSIAVQYDNLIKNENVRVFTYLLRFPNCTVLLPKSPFLLRIERHTPIWSRT